MPFTQNELFCTLYASAFAGIGTRLAKSIFIRVEAYSARATWQVVYIILITAAIVVNRNISKKGNKYKVRRVCILMYSYPF